MVKELRQYSAEFKMEAVKRVERGETASKVAADLGVNIHTMQAWIKRYKANPNMPFPGSGKLSPEDERIRALERQNRDLKEENEILKKAAAYFAKNQK
jgi:transposase